MIRLSVDPSVIALLSVLLPLAIGFAGWLIRLQARVGSLEKDFSYIRDDIREVREAQAGFRESINRIEQHLVGIAEQIKTVFSRMDRGDV